MSPRREAFGNPIRQPMMLYLQQQGEHVQQRCIPVLVANAEHAILLGSSVKQASFYLFARSSWQWPNVSVRPKKERRKYVVLCPPVTSQQRIMAETRSEIRSAAR
jgi:hypothetical protein